MADALVRRDVEDRRVDELAVGDVFAADVQWVTVTSVRPVGSSDTLVRVGYERAVAGGTAEHGLIAHRDDLVVARRFTP